MQLLFLVLQTKTITASKDNTTTAKQEQELHITAK